MTYRERKKFLVYQNDSETKFQIIPDMNHSSHQQVLYGRLRPTVNTDQSATERSIDKIKYYILSITQ
jgi:hypothetical protein